MLTTALFKHFLNNSVNPFPVKALFLHVYITTLLKTLWEKKKRAISPFHSVFYDPFEEHSASFIKFGNCLLQTVSVWKSMKYLV